MSLNNSLNNEPPGGERLLSSTRLADYFLVAGYSEEKSPRAAGGSGVLLQQFPSEKWHDVPFAFDPDNKGIGLEGRDRFLQPEGWKLSPIKKEPKFYVSVLTDALGARTYCACLCFYEPFKLIQLKPIDDDEDIMGEGGDDAHLLRQAKGQWYAPKVLSLLSRLNLRDTFRYCLGTIYKAFIESSPVRLEVMIGRLLSQSNVPPPGGPQLRFTIGGGDFQIIQPPLSPTIPVTGTSVTLLVNEIGITNLLVLFGAVVTEQKILFYSKSCSRLHDACGALEALMFPLKWLHTFIPLLPSTLIDIVQTPTPFIIGVLTETHDDITEILTDVIVVDLDGGSVFVPEALPTRASMSRETKYETPLRQKKIGKVFKKGKKGATLTPTLNESEIHRDKLENVTDDVYIVPHFPEPLWTEAFNCLSAVVHPELSYCDQAFPPLANKPSTPFTLDKEIRAVFIRLIAHLLQGYRSCLVIIRIYPSPVITFHHAKFLGGRGLSQNKFVICFLNTQAFNQFVSERGSPYRPLDIWDEYYAKFEEHRIQEKADEKLIYEHLSDIAAHLAHNESPDSTYSSKSLKPPDLSQILTNQLTFPVLAKDLVDKTIQEESLKHLHRHNSSLNVNQPKVVVPYGPKVLQPLDQAQAVTNNSARRLEVIRTCVADIFGNQITQASKSIHAVKKALGSKSARLFFCEELLRHKRGNVATLDRHQFDMIVALMQCTLQATSETDEEGVAAALLPLAMTFCRKLCSGVIQYVYTSIQDHQVWKNQNFWETSFNSDVEKDLLAFYTFSSESPPHGIYNSNHRTKDFSASERTALDVAAEQLRILPTLDPEKLKELAASDESTLFSQAIHYTNKMVYLLTKMDTPARKKERDTAHSHNHHFADNVSTITSIAESDSVGGESNVEDSSQETTMVLKIIDRFVDKVCTEGGVLESHVNKLNVMIRDSLDMQIETLVAVARESKRLPPIAKPKIPSPHFLAGEELMLDSIRVVMLMDGRDIGENVGGTTSDAPSNLNKSPLPAEGALFVTNYRVIFKGYPTDRTVSVPVIIRSFPLMALTKEKRITVNDLGIKDQEGSLIRSATFELLRLAFDEDIVPETIETYRKTLQRLRYSSDILSFFTFVGQASMSVSAYQGTKDKNSTLKKFLNTAKKVGGKPKPNSKKQKYVLSGWPQSCGTLPASTKYLGGNLVLPQSSREDGDNISLGSASSLSEVSDDDFPTPQLSASDPKSIERILERIYAKDWRRLGFGNQARTPGSSAATLIHKAESMRFSFANCAYSLCATYPALLVVPQGVSDESLKNLSVAYNCGRFPVVTWKHPFTRALLLRGAAMNSKGLTSRVFSQKNPGGGTHDTTHVEQENFLRAVVNATPGKPGRPTSIVGLYESSLSLNLNNHGVNNALAHYLEVNPGATVYTPEIGRRAPSSNRFHRAMDTIRYATGGGTSGGRGVASYGSWVLGKNKATASTARLPYGMSSPPFRTMKDVDIDAEKKIPTLYVFVEKSKIKALKGDVTSKVEFVPAYPCPDLSKVRSSFKQLLRACIPSTPGPQNFLMEFERSEWLVHLQSIIRLSGAVVELMDKQGSSVMLCLGDGADITAQISAIAQISLDPYYRTMEGFHALIEKEWLGFGHKFSDRNNVSGVDGYRGKESFTPIFMQFLDIVHQMVAQFPLAFEFNQRYLKYLAHHSVSGRFRTFIFDSEWDRVKYGFVALDDKRGSLPKQYRGVDPCSDEICRKSGPNNTSCQSLFEYVEKIHAKQPIFRNFLYEKQTDLQVLYVATGFSNLVPWDYYLELCIGVGSPYDLELCSLEEAINEEKERHDEYPYPNRHLNSRLESEFRKTVSAPIDVPERSIPDYFTHTLEEMNRRETEKCLLPQDWSSKWDRIEGMQIPSPPPVSSPSSRLKRVAILESRDIIESAHQKSTVDILVQGKSQQQKHDLPVSNHIFVRRTFAAFEPCEGCSGILFGKVALQCGICGRACHEKCAELIPMCMGEEIAGNGLLTLEAGQHSAGTDTEYSHSPTQSPRLSYDKFQSRVTDETTYSGILYKRGAMLKGWTPRFFVLDSTKHQLRYYETKEDTHPKGFIDLSEVKRCGYPESSMPQLGTPFRKDRQDDGCVFEVKTSRRMYCLAASTPEVAAEWIERIQGSLI